MMAPLPPSNLSADRPELPRVRLDVRSGSGRAVSYEVGADEFLIGGANGCDLRLPAPSLPPVILQITRKPDGVRVRKLTPLLPVLLNNEPLPANTPTSVNSGDTLSLAGIEITIATESSGLIIPRFVAIEAEEETVEAPPPSAATDLSAEHRKLDERRRQLESEEVARREDWKRKDEELIRRTRDLDRQTEDLESDRVIWYRRRQELERELENQQSLLGPAAARNASLDTRERELVRMKEEHSTLRERLLKEYQEKRDELALQQEELRELNARLQSDRQLFDTDQEKRREELQSEVEKHRQNLDSETIHRRGLLDEELKQRRTTFEAELAARTSQAEAESLGRHREQFEELDRLRASARDIVARAETEAAAIRDEAAAYSARAREAVAAEVAEHEPKKRDLQEREERLNAAQRELDRQRDLFAADQDVFSKARATFEARQEAETERLISWERTLSVGNDDLDLRKEQLQTERTSLERDRTQFQDDLVRLERRTAALEGQERTTAERAREVDVRLEQLKRDSQEWEETIRLATAEQERLRTEAERLDRQKAELDAQSATLAERAGQLEAQQAVLAVLRSKLDRTRQEAEREATQLAVARTREDEALAELRSRIREAEELRAVLTNVQENAAQERLRLEERDSLLSVGLQEIRQQKESLSATSARLQQHEFELDSRAADIAEQVGALKGRMTQALDLQARLEADRVALREREAALAQAEEARQTLQDQLRRRAEDLASRSRALDEMARQVAADRAFIDQTRAGIENERLTTTDELAERRRQLDERATEVARLAAEYAVKEEALNKQVARLKDVGAAVAEERKSMTEARMKWEADRAAAIEADRQSREELASFRAQALSEIEALRRQAPELEGQAIAAFERLSAARETLRGHLAELNDFARLSREDLGAIRMQVRQEAERLREQEDSLNRSKAEHRLSVSGFRQQLIEWQGQVAEMKRLLSNSESRLDARQAAVDQAAKQVDATTVQLAEQAEQLKREREVVSARRTEVERHLADMREWYRKKLRELASGRAVNAERIEELGGISLDKPRLASFDTADPFGPEESEPTLRLPAASMEELDPGDRQLGELLRSHGLVDVDSLNALWSEASRQRRTLRQVLLASGVITLYQLALIEAGNLDALMLGRFRVIERLRVTPREAIYRVFDPSDPGRGDTARATGGPSGIYLLRHLAEAEMHDAAHADEFRQRFQACRDAPHPNLSSVKEVLEINSRPAAVQEWLTGLFSADWPAQAAHPGCWVRLATMAASGIEAAHRNGLIHGRITSDSFVLTASGVLKVTGFGEPPWLTTGPAPIETTTAADLRAFGQVVHGWSQLIIKRKGTAKPKPFPEDLLSVIRRLEADPEPPMADTVAADRPYSSASELVADLYSIARETSFSDDAWEKLLKHVADHAPDAPAGLKRSA
jgi:hypothetical protein